MASIKRLTIVLILLFALPCLADNGASFHGSGHGVADGGGISYDYTEDFEGTGYGNGTCGTAPCWTEVGTGTIDPDYTGVVLAGAQSLQLDDYDEAHYARAELSLTAATNNIDIYFIFETTDQSPGAEDILTGLDGSSNIAFQISITAPADLYLEGTHGSTVSASTYSIATSQAYHIWADYNIGTGADGVLDIYIATTATKPETPSVSISNGNGTYQVVTLQFQGRDMESLFDSIKVNVDGTAIGSNP